MQRERYRSLTRLIPILYSVVVVTVLGLMLSFARSAPSWLIIYLPTAMLFVVISRMNYWIKARSRVNETTDKIMKRDMLSTSILGPGITVGFAFLGLWLGQYGNQAQQSMAALVIWIGAIACAFCLVALPKAAIGVVLAAMLPIGSSLVLTGDGMMIGLATAFSAISCLVIYMLHQNYLSMTELVNSRTEVEERQAQTEAAKEAVSVMAFTDSMTGLPNRRYFERMLREKSINGHFAVCMIDIDGFKLINDVHGHAVGDIVLQTLADRLQECLGGSGRVARMGGDEFAAIIPGLDNQERAESLGKMISRRVSEPVIVDTISARVTASCGIAFNDREDDDLVRVLDRADMALFRAKKIERGCVCVFTEQFEKAALERAKIEQELRAAVANDQMTVYFQPIIDLNRGRLQGFEALARWTDPTLGPISPALFIPIAEQIGIIEQLTDCLLHKAACIAAKWPNHLLLAFNLSAEQLVKPSAGLRILTALEKAGLPPFRFEAEVTETAIMKDLPAARHTIECLRAAGCRVSLDDFGTGYSSLSQIKDLPLDKLKIDKSFVDNICGDAKIGNIVRAIISMCSCLELTCVAEGIELKEQMDALKLNGCEGGQGYLFSRPVPEHEAHVIITDDAKLTDQSGKAA